jgi:hypothetical protein
MKGVCRRKVQKSWEKIFIFHHRKGKKCQILCHSISVGMEVTPYDLSPENAVALIASLSAAGSCCSATLSSLQAIVEYTGGPGLRKERVRVCKARGTPYPEVSTHLVSAGVVPPLVAALQAHKTHAECAQWLAHCIRNIQPPIEASDALSLAWASAGALPLLLECLQLHKEHLGLCAIACGAISNLSSGGDEVGNLLAQAGAVELLVSVLQRHLTSARLVDMVAGAVGNLCANPDRVHTRAFLKANLLPVLAQALRLHHAVPQTVETLAYCLSYLTHEGESVVQAVCTGTGGDAAPMLPLLLDAFARHTDPCTLATLGVVVKNVAYYWGGVWGGQALAQARCLAMVEHCNFIPACRRLYDWCDSYEGEEPLPAYYPAPLTSDPYTVPAAAEAPEAAAGGSISSTGSSTAAAAALPEAGAGTPPPPLLDPEEGDSAAKYKKDLAASLIETLDLLKYSPFGVFQGKSPTPCATAAELLPLLRAGAADCAHFKLSAKALAVMCWGQPSARAQCLAAGALPVLLRVLQHSLLGSRGLDAPPQQLPHLHARIFRALAALAPAAQGREAEALQGCAGLLLQCLAGGLGYAPQPRPTQWAAALLGLLLVGPGAAGAAQRLLGSCPEAGGVVLAALERCVREEGQEAVVGAWLAHLLKCLLLAGQGLQELQGLREGEGRQRLLAVAGSAACAGNVGMRLQLQKALEGL